MTDREKAIVMAYTGYCMLTGDKLSVFYEYVESIMGRPVYTHEMGIKAVDDEIKEKAKADFIALCAEQEPCDDAISRQAEIDAFNRFADEVNQDTDIHEAIEIVLNLPPVTPTEKVGHWIPNYYFYGVYDYTCSKCEKHCKERSKFCPNCGAKMTEEEQNGR